MKTDAFFYELFRFDPNSLFQLAGLNIAGKYEFESITTKTTERRVDGFFKRTDGNGPNVFLEIQGYSDKGIYWRLFREICTWYEQTGSTTPFIAIVLFINEKFDPGQPFLSCNSPCELIRCNLVDCLNEIKGNAGVLTVLKPLVLKSKKELAKNLHRWKSDIDALQLPEDRIKILTELMEYTILQRFPKLTLNEVRKMIRLTPLEETVAVKELIEMGIKQGIEQGVEKGIKKGELIGMIQMARQMLKYPMIPKKELISKDIKELRMMLSQLESKLPTS